MLDQTSIQNTLEQLKPLHLPKAISWWPMAPGWWIISGLVLSGIILYLFFYIKNYKKNKTKKIFLNQLNKIKIQNNNPIANINILLRQFCLTLYPKQQFSSLYGLAWCEYLDNLSKFKIFKTTLIIFSTGPYIKNQKINPEIYNLLKKWVKHV